MTIKIVVDSGFDLPPNIAEELDITTIQYFSQTLEALTMDHFSVGLIKSAVFGLLVAGSGCLRGMQCTGSASAVGNAATSAVVTIITTVIIADAMFAILFQTIGI